jgi:hypothetical protein
MQILLAVELVRKEPNESGIAGWQISDGFPPLTGFRRVHCHRVIRYNGLGNLVVPSRANAAFLWERGRPTNTKLLHPVDQRRSLHS